MEKSWRDNCTRSLIFLSKKHGFPVLVSVGFFYDCFVAEVVLLVLFTFQVWLKVYPFGFLKSCIVLV